jgi:hypothetical protein
MPRILSYPNYCPNKFNLRALLLFYDDIRTIVPEEDQLGVARRDHLFELERYAGTRPIEFVDPKYSLFAWERDERTFETFIRLAQKNAARMETGLKQLVTVAQRNRYAPETQTLTSYLQDLGWSYVAAPKISDKTLDQLIDLKVALPVQHLINRETGTVVEYDPILMPSELANFAISRLARDLANRENRVPVTLEDTSHYASLYKGGVALPDRRQYLLSSFIHAAIPACLGELEPDRYWDLRQEYSGVRLRLNDLLNATLVQHDLDGSDDFKDFIGHTGTVVNSLRREIDAASRKFRPTWLENSRTFAIDTAFTLVGPVVGAALGGYQGAIAGAGLTYIAGRASEYFSTRDDNLLTHIGHMRGNIANAAKPISYSVPRYMV